MNGLKVQDTITNITAVSAVASPFWLPSFQSVSEVFGLLLPVVGVIWLVVQIFLAVKNRKR